MPTVVDYLIYEDPFVDSANLRRYANGSQKHRRLAIYDRLGLIYEGFDHRRL
jgi:hypothetical protein